MRFHNVAESLFGSKEKIEILRLLTKYPKEYTSREIARHAHVSVTWTIKLLSDFQTQGLVSGRRIGRSALWMPNKNNKLYIMAKLFFSQEENLISIDLGSTIRIAFSKYQHIIKKAILYGSIAAGKERPDSDVDVLLIVYSKGDWLEEVTSRLRELFMRNYGNMLSLLAYTEKEWQSASAQLKKEVEGGIVIWPAK